MNLFQRRSPNCPKTKQEQKDAEKRRDAAVKGLGIAKGKVTKAKNELARLESNAQTPHDVLTAKRANIKRLEVEKKQLEGLVTKETKAVTHAGNEYVKKCIKNGPGN